MFTPAEFKEDFPEFASLTDAKIQRFILRAQPYINAKVWGVKTEYAWMLMTAHLLKSIPDSSGGGGGGGPVQSEKVGDLQTTFAVAVPQAGTLSSSSYGDLLIQLRKSILVSPIIGG